MAPTKTNKGRRVKIVPKGTFASKKLVKAIKSVSKKTALGLMETKFVSSSNQANFNSAVALGFGEMYSLIPKVSSGIASYQRENDDITPVNIRTNWHIALTTANRSMNVRCVLYCLQHKSIKHFPDLVAITNGPKFLKTGNPTLTQGYSGFIGDEDLPINKEEYTLLKKFTFNLMANVGAPNGDTNNGNSPNTLPSFKNISYTYPAKRQIRYTPDGTAIYPNGHAPFWVLGYSHTDGTQPDVLFQDVAVSWVNQMTYKDA